MDEQLAKTFQIVYENDIARDPIFDNWVLKMTSEEAEAFDIKRWGLDKSVSGCISEEMFYHYQFKGSERAAIKKLIGHLLDSLEGLALQDLD